MRRRQRGLITGLEHRHSCGTCNGTGAQNWVPQPNGTLVDPNSEKCPDVSWGKSADGTPLIVYTCHDGASEE
ncbi:RICIN domain-containing protein [Streptomyces sp.]|uniref:RICIN domain-containing protein n=1 Tax=Streptomyces sp. TaxID=1931 RepID=UPI002D77A883|nr:RICIN domain-containing protein [Streptomyces sp.]HET6357958.1 RICIN domain-containing protein [Streptomyces sp.]